LRDLPLDEAMVFAEMHAENQAYYHGVQAPGFSTVHKTADFNGKVHVRYSGSNQAAEAVRKKMDILEAHFAEWASNNAFSSTDPSEEATLEAVYEV
jgi:hypothetical protein